MIVLLETVHPEAMTLLQQVDDVRLMVGPTELDADLLLDEVRAVFTRGRGRIDADMFRRLPNLEVVGRFGAGLDNIDTAAAASAHVPVVFAPGSTTYAVSEHAVMLMLALARKTASLDRAVKRDEWSVRDGHEATELREKQLAIVGLGHIGRRIATIGRALDMRVAYWSRSSREASLPRYDLGELISTADVIQICVALTPQTRHLIGADQFALMKPGVLLVNTARGQIVDHEALRGALDVGVVGGYATDVWDPEPPLDRDPLIRDDRVLVTPHVAALTDGTYREICVRPATAAVAILRGEQPDPNCVYRR